MRSISSTLIVSAVRGAVAEYERIKIAERYRRGKLFRARQGEVCWWKVPYGYRRIPRRDGVPAHVEVSEPEAQVVRQIFRWHVDERLSVRQIALRLTESAHVTATGLPRWATRLQARPTAEWIPLPVPRSSTRICFVVPRPSITTTAASAPAISSPAITCSAG